jgi:hypothetical protein
MKSNDVIKNRNAPKHKKSSCPCGPQPMIINHIQEWGLI